MRKKSWRSTKRKNKIKKKKRLFSKNWYSTLISEVSAKHLKLVCKVMERLHRRTTQKKDLNEPNNTMVGSVIQGQTFWSVVSSGP